MANISGTGSLQRRFLLVNVDSEGIIGHSWIVSLDEEIAYHCSLRFPLLNLDMCSPFFRRDSKGFVPTN